MAAKVAGPPRPTKRGKGKRKKNFENSSRASLPTSKRGGKKDTRWGSVEARSRRAIRPASTEDELISISTHFVEYPPRGELIYLKYLM